MEGIIPGNIFYFDWEVSLIEWLQSSIGPVWTKLAELFSLIGGEAITLVVLLVLLFCWSKEKGKRCGVRIMAASIWFPMIKNVVLRLRPYMAHETIDIADYNLPETDADPMDVVQQGYSFPSGHSATAASMYGSVAWEERKKKWVWVLAIVMILFIGVSRFVVAAHYPTDVLAGWAVGLLAIVVMRLMEKKIPNENIRNLILLGTALPGLFWCTSRDYFTALGLLAGMVIVFPYEKKYVNYQDTRKVPVMVLRVLGAVVVYFVLNKLMKLPFSSEFLNSGMLGANLIRSLRYAVILFVLLGVYPRCFPALEKLFTRKQQ